MLLKIGYFALISQVPVKTLRYYDEIGLLPAVQVDAFTGYRYYNTEQLPRLNRILALKDLGLSLEQIALLLDKNLSNEQLVAMLQLRQAQLQGDVAELQAQLGRVEVRLKQASEGHMTNYEIVLKTVKPMLVASQRMIVPTNDQVPTYLGNAYDAICKHMAAHNLKTAGPCLTVWHSLPQMENEDVEAAFPIDREIPSSESVQIHRLPEVYVASAVHQGNFDEFTQAHAAILKWVEANDYQLLEQYREIYIAGPNENAGVSTTEVQFVVKRNG
jgi:DNA-binding transcriptional MerR regulator